MLCMALMNSLFMSLMKVKLLSTASCSRQSSNTCYFVLVSLTVP